MKKVFLLLLVTLFTIGMNAQDNCLWAKCTYGNDCMSEAAYFRGVKYHPGCERDYYNTPQGKKQLKREEQMVKNVFRGFLSGLADDMKTEQVMTAQEEKKAKLERDEAERRAKLERDEAERRAKLVREAAERRAKLAREAAEANVQKLKNTLISEGFDKQFINDNNKRAALMRSLWGEPYVVYIVDTGEPTLEDYLKNEGTLYANKFIAALADGRLTMEYTIYKGRNKYSRAYCSECLQDETTELFMSWKAKTSTIVAEEKAEAEVVSKIQSRLRSMVDSKTEKENKIWQDLKKSRLKLMGDSVKNFKEDSNLSNYSFKMNNKKINKKGFKSFVKEEEKQER